MLDLLLKIVGFNADRTCNPLSTNVVIAVAAHINDEHPVPLIRLQTRGKFLNLHARHDAIFPIPEELDGAVDRIDHERCDKDGFHYASCHVKPSQSNCEEITRNISH